MTERDAMLGGIAENPDDDARRLVFSDWLEENGDLARADFFRVQCALASDLPDERRQSLRRRERELLDSHRRDWIAATGLPLEAVGFRRGLIAAARLSAWDARMLEAPWLAGLEELDLSALALGSDELAAFARKARLPALRKLLLNDNGITDAGALALASATGSPRLDAVYLFGNPISEDVRAAFRQKSLDAGEPAEGYSMTPDESDAFRRRFVREQLLPIVSRYFAEHGLLRSAMLCVAQFWDDEASDAVHGLLVVSELPEPVLEGLGWGDEGTDPNLPNKSLKPKFRGRSGSIIDFYDIGVRWGDNSDAIPLWAAFSPEGGSQHHGRLSENYAPAVMFYSHGGYEFLPMPRPHLDGIRPERD